MSQYVNNIRKNLLGKIVFRSNRTFIVLIITQYFLDKYNERYIKKKAHFFLCLNNKDILSSIKIYDYLNFTSSFLLGTIHRNSKGSSPIFLYECAIPSGIYTMLPDETSLVSLPSTI